MGCALNVRRQSARTICAARRSRMHLHASEHPCEQPHAEDAVKAGSFCGDSYCVAQTDEERFISAPQEHSYACIGTRGCAGIRVDTVSAYADPHPAPSLASKI